MGNDDDAMTKRHIRFLPSGVLTPEKCVLILGLRGILIYFYRFWPEKYLEFINPLELSGTRNNDNVGKVRNTLEALPV